MTAKPATNGTAKHAAKKPHRSPLLRTIKTAVRRVSTASKKLMLSKPALDILTQLAQSLLVRIATETNSIRLFHKKKTVSVKHVQSALREVMPGEILGATNDSILDVLDRYNNALKMKEEWQKLQPPKVKTEKQVARDEKKRRVKAALQAIA